MKRKNRHRPAAVHSPTTNSLKSLQGMDFETVGETHYISLSGPLNCYQESGPFSDKKNHLAFNSPLKNLYGV
jgi:hypothetical protein